MLESIELLYFAYRSFTSRPDRMLAQRGLGRVHHRILYFLGRNPEITVNQLIATLKVSKQALNAPLRQLIERGLVLTRTAEQDRRSKQLRLSAAGKKLEQQLSATQAEHLAKAFAAAGQGAAEGWQRAMREIIGNAEEASS